MDINNKTVQMQTSKESALRSEQYTPERLLDALIKDLGVKNDAGLARAMKVTPPVISKIRHRTRPVLPSLLIRMYDVSGFSIEQLRRLMGRPDAYFQ